MKESYWGIRYRLTRRGFLRGAGVAAGALTLGPAVAACGASRKQRSGGPASYQAGARPVKGGSLLERRARCQIEAEVGESRRSIPGSSLCCGSACRVIVSRPPGVCRKTRFGPARNAERLLVKTQRALQVADGEVNVRKSCRLDHGECPQLLARNSGNLRLSLL